MYYENIFKDIEKMVKKERKAHENIPLFNSNYEAVAVLKEEIDEAVEDVQRVIYRYDDVWDCVKKDKICKSAVKEVKKFAEYAVAELIQVIAMCEKFIESEEKRSAKWKL